MYSLQIEKDLIKKLHKLEKKDKKQLEAIDNKLKEILEEPHRYKPLRYDLKNIRRVHIMKSFVLTFKIDEENQKVVLLDYDHHDNIY